MILQVSNYIDGDLDIVLKREIELHLEGCPECRIVFSQTKLTVEVFNRNGKMESRNLDTDVRSRLHDKLRRKMQEQRPAQQSSTQ